MKIGITGTSGLLGSELCLTAAEEGLEVKKLERAKLQLMNGVAGSLEYVAGFNLDVIIHCAANTDVEGCEVDPEGCYKDNVLFTEMLACACKQLDIFLVFISSTGVYGNHKLTPYIEYDSVIPTTIHHRSKWLAEQSVRLINSDSLIIRTGWLFGGSYDLPKNFVANRIKEALHADGEIRSDKFQTGNPTYARDVAKTIFYLLESGWIGTFNCVNSGSATRFAYVKKIVELSKADADVVPSTEPFKRIAQVSSNESVINFKLNQLRIPKMPSWEESLKSYIHELESNYIY